MGFFFLRPSVSVIIFSFAFNPFLSKHYVLNHPEKESSDAEFPLFYEIQCEQTEESCGERKAECAKLSVQS